MSTATGTMFMEQPPQQQAYLYPGNGQPYPHHAPPPPPPADYSPGRQPYSTPPQLHPSAHTFQGAIVPSASPSPNAYGYAPPSPQQPVQPFPPQQPPQQPYLGHQPQPPFPVTVPVPPVVATSPQQQPQPPPVADPFAPVAAPAPIAGGAPSSHGAAPPSGDDPFGIFAAAAGRGDVPAPISKRAVSASTSSTMSSSHRSTASAEESWLNIGPSSRAPEATDGGGGSSSNNNSSGGPTAADGSLPPGGQLLEVYVSAPTLGTMLHRARDLSSSLYLRADPALVRALGDRPVVSHLTDQSAAESSGARLGHVLLSVDGARVRDPTHATDVLRQSHRRPLSLRFYVPEVQVVVAQGDLMVHYKTKEEGVPQSARGWKRKYVVVGGIIAQPYMMSMFRSKSEYDTAVAEVNAGRSSVKVKVKQFDLRGCLVRNAPREGPPQQTVRYPGEMHSRNYLVVLPRSSGGRKGPSPIKLSSFVGDGQLGSVYEGIRRAVGSG